MQFALDTDTCDDPDTGTKLLTGWGKDKTKYKLAYVIPPVQTKDYVKASVPKGGEKNNLSLRFLRLLL